MLRRLLNYFQHPYEVIVRNLFVKQITHGINKIHRGSLTSDGFVEPLGKKRQAKPIFVTFNMHSPEASGHNFGVTISAAGGDLAAADSRVPSLLCPFNGGFGAHYFFLI